MKIFMIVNLIDARGIVGTHPAGWSFVVDHTDYIGLNAHFISRENAEAWIEAVQDDEDFPRLTSGVRGKNVNPELKIVELDLCEFNPSTDTLTAYLGMRR